MTLRTLDGVIKDLGMGNEVECGNIYFRMNVLRYAGDKIDGHHHNFPHATFFWSGEFLLRARKAGAPLCEEDITSPDIRLRARKAGVLLCEEDIIAPDIRLILPDIDHEIIAKTDNCLFLCVYAHRDPQGNVIQRCEGYSAAYR